MYFTHRHVHHVHNVRHQRKYKKRTIFNDLLFFFPHCDDTSTHEGCWGLFAVKYIYSVIYGRQTKLYRSILTFF